MNLMWILLPFIVFLTSVHCVRIEDNGYKGIVISFSEKALQKPFDFEKLKDVLRNASELLFHATRNRSYFEEFVFVVPSKWTESNVCEDDAIEVPKNVDIYVTDSAEIHSLSAQHSKGCGQRGDIIYLPRDWLTGNVQDLAHHFVQKWSTFRYGVFPENPERPGSCIAISDSSWYPTGCYNTELDVEASFDENGLPVCYLPEDFKENENLHSSIMFSSNSSKVLDFCDGSESFPHNPIAPTLHNRLCEGKTVWSVVRKTEDFLYGRNFPVEDSKPPAFRCFKESKPHMTLVVQDTDSEARSEIRYAFVYFLSNITATDFRVSLVTFSNDSLTDATDPVELPLQDGEKLKLLLLNNLKLNKKVQDICLICGLRKAYKVSAESQHSLRIIVLFAPASSLLNTDISQLTELIRSDRNAVLHMLFLENTENDVIPSSLVDTVQEVRGRIFRIKNERVFMFSQMNIALVDASKSILHTEDKVLVVHEKTRLKIASNFHDVFMTPKNIKGTLLYSIQCKNRGDIRNENNDCSILDQELQSPICESKLDLNGDEEFSNVRKYSFEYMAGSEGSTCVSLALLKLVSSSENPFSVRGWLNENKITPGLNALIIYAEVFSGKNDVLVEAVISGPGLTDFRLELRDNGNGDPDIIKGDNIYSRYFTSFSQKGTYTVWIYVKSLTANGNATEETAENTENVASQTKIVGSFWVTESPPKEDIIPPNRVTDLNVISVDNTNRTALLQWTAPGSDHDNGKAKSYSIKLSRHWMHLLDSTFDLKENVLLNTDQFFPANSGTIENLRIQNPMSNNNITYYIALRAVDDKNNMGKISNIIQIYFREAHFPTDDPLEISTETSNKETSHTVFSIISTEVSTYTSAEPENRTTEEENTKFITTETIEGMFIKKNTIIIVASTSGAIIILLIIINIIVCCCCFRKKRKSEKPKKVSRNNSLRPPYNLNIAYRQGSQSSLDENVVSNSTSTLVDPSSVYSSSEERAQTQTKYTYHTSHSLTNKMEIPNVKNNLGFKLVQPMPAYATSSLSRFAARQSNTYEDDLETSNTRSNESEHHTLNNAQNTHVYSLGEV